MYCEGSGGSEHISNFGPEDAASKVSGYLHGLAEARDGGDGLCGIYWFEASGKKVKRVIVSFKAMMPYVQSILLVRYFKATFRWNIQNQAVEIRRG